MIIFANFIIFLAVFQYSLFLSHIHNTYKKDKVVITQSPMFSSMTIFAILCCTCFYYLMMKKINMDGMDKLKGYVDYFRGVPTILFLVGFVPIGVGMGLKSDSKKIHAKYAEATFLMGAFCFYPVLWIYGK